jgi:hypothetical protein
MVNLFGERNLEKRKKERIEMKKLSLILSFCFTCVCAKTVEFSDDYYRLCSYSPYGDVRLTPLDESEFELIHSKGKAQVLMQIYHMMDRHYLRVNGMRAFSRSRNESQEQKEQALFDYELFLKLVLNPQNVLVAAFVDSSEKHYKYVFKQIEDDLLEVIFDFR